MGSAHTPRRDPLLGGGSAAQETGPNDDWPRILDEHGVRFLALDRHGDRNLVRFFRSHPGWMVDYEDGEAVLFARASVIQAQEGRPK